MPGQFQFYDDSLMFHGSMGYIMGTRFDIISIGKSKETSEAVWQYISLELIRLDKMLNRFDPNSEISHINNFAVQESVSLSNEFWKILLTCKEFHKRTLGLFDITLTDFTKIDFNYNSYSIRFQIPGLLLDLGGYAKGYALKKINQILVKSTVNQAFVNFGNSSILGIGHHPFGHSWKISINNPYKAGEAIDEIDLIDMSLSTSGNTPSYPKHIINPTTGKYDDTLKLVCVKAKDPVVAEVVSTSLMIASQRERKEILRNFEVEFTQTYTF